jgi:hypothetical protein
MYGEELPSFDHVPVGMLQESSEESIGRLKKCNLMRGNGERMSENGLFRGHVVFRHEENEIVRKVLLPGTLLLPGTGN